MPEFRRLAPMPVSADALFAWHEREGAFERLAPPWQRIEPVSADPSVRDGTRRTFRLRQGPFSVTWVARHQDYQAGRQFADVQEQGPFAAWRHTHRCESTATGSVLDDHIAYRLPLGALGQAIAGGTVDKMLDAMFAFRHARTAEDLSRHAPYADLPRLTVAVTGATGMVGRQLCAFLTTGGHTVRPVVRRKSGAANEILWSPAEGTIDAAALEGVDAVVHLAGENIGGARWTPEFKRQVLASRVQGTELIAKTMAGLQRPPRVLVSASAIGLYGDRGDEPLTEDEPRGAGFLADVCEAWEAATAPAVAAGIRVVNLRIGVVLAAQGGALPQMLLPFKLGAGGPLGSGRQVMSWVGLDDVIYAIHHAIRTESLRGPVNLTAPNPLTNAALAKVIGNVLHRPALLPTPAFALRLVLGRQKADEMVLAGQRVVPRRLLDSGFRFQFSEAEAALRFTLGRG